MSDHGKIYSTKFQDSLERSTIKLALVIALAVAVGGIVEIVPLFYLDTTMTHLSPNVKESQKNAGDTSPIVWNRKPGESLDDWKPGDGVRPYKPLELAGREVYTTMRLDSPQAESKTRYDQLPAGYRLYIALQYN